MLQFSQLSPSKIDAQSGVIYGVCVMSKGEAKGHNLQIDSTSLDQFLVLAKGHKDGVKVRFGENHDAKVDDTVGVLKNLRIENERVIADMHLLLSDSKCNKLVEMAEKMPNEFGLSAVADAEKEGKEFVSPLRFTALDCVDIVDSPAATKGLFFSQQTQNTNKPSMKNIALALGLPESATEEQIIEASKLAFEAKCKADAEAEAKAKKKELEGDDEEKGKEGKKQFDAVLERLAKLESVEAERAKQVELAAASAHKAEIENLKLEASKEGKVISLSDEALLKLSVKEVKEHIAALPKNQVKLAAGFKPSVDNKPLDKRSEEFKAQLAAKKAEGALLLGQKMLKN